jgi:hypothetical protein
MLTHAQTFFRGILSPANTAEKRLRMRGNEKMARNLNAKL